MNNVTLGSSAVTSTNRESATCNFKGGQNMSWNAVYIRGRDGFQQAIISKLKRTWMQGTPEAKDDLVMFWLPHTHTLRSLKVTIGSKLIWKYRLHFITNLNSHLKSKGDKSAEFSVLETEMIGRMVQLDNAQRDLTKTGT